jgi:hypothetical protein
VTLDGVLNWILDLLITYIHDSELKAITATANLHKPFSACCGFTSRPLLTASNSGDSSASVLKPSLNGCSLPTASFLRILPYRTESDAPVIFVITRLHGPSRKHCFYSISIIAYESVAAGTCSPSRFIETNVVLEPFASNGCVSGSAVLALSKYVTIFRTSNFLQN